MFQLTIMIEMSIIQRFKILDSRSPTKNFGGRPQWESRFKGLDSRLRGSDNTDTIAMSLPLRNAQGFGSPSQ